MFYQVYYTDFFKNRVTVVTEADSEEKAIHNVNRSETVVNSPYAQKISEQEFNKFAKVYKTVDVTNMKSILGDFYKNRK